MKKLIILALVSTLYAQAPPSQTAEEQRWQENLQLKMQLIQLQATQLRNEAEKYRDSVMKAHPGMAAQFNLQTLQWEPKK